MYKIKNPSHVRSQVIRKIKQYVAVLSVEYFPLAVAGLFIGVSSSHQLFGFDALIAVFSNLFLVGGFNSFNAVFDKEIDVINKPGRPLPSNQLSVRSILFYAVFLYFVGFFLAAQINWVFLFIYLVSAVITVLYSLPPFQFKKRYVLNTLSAVSVFGVLCPLSGWSIFYESDLDLFLYGFLFLLGFGLSISKDFEDYGGDYVFGVRNFVTVYGCRKAWNIMYLFMSVSFFYWIVLLLLGFISFYNVFIIFSLFISAWLYYFGVKFDVFQNKGMQKRFFYMFILLGVLTEVIVGAIYLIN